MFSELGQSELGGDYTRLPGHLTVSKSFPAQGAQRSWEPTTKVVQPRARRAARERTCALSTNGIPDEALSTRAMGSVFGWGLSLARRTNLTRLPPERGRSPPLSRPPNGKSKLGQLNTACWQRECNGNWPDHWPYRLSGSALSRTTSCRRNERNPTGTFPRSNPVVGGSPTRPTRSDRRSPLPGVIVELRNALCCRAAGLLRSPELLDYHRTGNRKVGSLGNLMIGSSPGPGCWNGGRAFGRSRTSEVGPLPCLAFRRDTMKGIGDLRDRDWCNEDAFEI